MKNHLEYILIVCILIIYFKNVETEYFTNKQVESNIDKRKYKVVGGFKDNETAANKMAFLNKFVFNFLRFLKTKFIINKKGLLIEQNFVKRILQNYNPDVIFENNPKPGEDTSYVINKGQEFAICLRNKTNNEFHENNLLIFVVIHELSHLGTIDYGHEYEFWSWFKFMLIQATEAGLYIPVDYSKQNETYCGMDVSFNPMFSNYDWRIKI